MLTLTEMIDNLNVDLAEEYFHWHFYMHYSTLVQGLHREEISEFLLKEAKGEMEHIEEFKRLIIGLGGIPVVSINNRRKAWLDSTVLTDPKDILSSALAMEDEVVTSYVFRIDDAQKLQQNGGKDKVDGKYIELFLEEQILNSRGDADNIREMIK